LRLHRRLRNGDQRDEGGGGGKKEDKHQGEPALLPAISVLGAGFHDLERLAQDCED
jgi:hypothetical protein